MGFYKKLSETKLQYAPNFVYNANFYLTKEDKGLEDMKEQDGWKWFTTKALACAYFAVTEAVWTEDRVKELDSLDYNEKITLLNKSLTTDTIDSELTATKVISIG